MVSLMYMCISFIDKASADPTKMIIKIPWIKMFSMLRMGAKFVDNEKFN